MNAKQKRFCDEYLVDCNAKQAAIRAGYSSKTAYSIGNENLNKPELRAYIDEQLKRIHNEKTADAQEIIEFLTKVMRGEQTEQTLRLVSNGIQEIENIEVSMKDRLNAADKLARMNGLFVDKAQLNADVKLDIKIDYGDDDGNE